MGVLLTTQGVTKRFGGLTALSGVDFQLEEGTISSVIGPNGAGKTTLFNVLTGVYQPDGGEVRFRGHSLRGLRPDQITALGMCRTFQNIRLFANMTVVENVLVGMHCRIPLSMADVLGRTRRFHREESALWSRASALLDVVALRPKANEVAKNLPYGEQRRLELARALASSPVLLLLDEPTAGMNPQETAEFTAFVSRVRDEKGLTVLLIEHDMKVVMGVSERITVLEYGAKIAEGTPEEIRADERVIEAYLGTGATG
jgi:branched-chain amino acid transport system ATP-binding protein